MTGVELYLNTQYEKPDRMSGFFLLFIHRYLFNSVNGRKFEPLILIDFLLYFFFRNCTYTSLI